MTTPAVLDTRDEWRAEARDWIIHRAAYGIAFDSNDLRKAIPAPPHHNMIGAAINSAARTGIIQAVGISRATQRVGNGRRTQLWNRYHAA